MSTSPTPSPAPRPRSDAQRYASRRNGARSTGPGATGRMKSRLNGLRHGLRSASPETMTPKLRAEVDAHRAAFRTAHGPRDDYERIVIDQAADAAARRADLEALIADRQQELAQQAEVDLAAARERQLATDLALYRQNKPAAVAALRQTPDGCAYLADSLLALAAGIEASGRWTEDHYLRARFYSGVRDEPDPHLEPVAARVVELGRVFYRRTAPRPAADSDVADPLAAEQAELLDLLEGLADEAADRCERLFAEREAAGIPAARSALAAFEVSPEGRLWRRYLNEAARHQHKAMADFYRHRRQQSEGLDTAPPQAAVASDPAPDDASETYTERLLRTMAAGLTAFREQSAPETPSEPEPAPTEAPSEPEGSALGTPPATVPVAIAPVAPIVPPSAPPPIAPGPA